jgi:thiol-disulfide isomerase/thioredoxin
MGYVRLAAVYTALVLVANAATADMSALEALREGDMRKLTFHAEPVPAALTVFDDGAGGELSLEAFQGKVVMVNFWATWCAPCRVEMPTLSALQAEFGGDDFAVITIATGRNDPAAMERFFGEIGVTNLPLYRDPTQALARDMGVLGLPITVILDPSGMEIARLQGDADWHSDSARAIVAALIGESSADNP